MYLDMSEEQRNTFNNLVYELTGHERGGWYDVEDYLKVALKDLYTSYLSNNEVYHHHVMMSERAPKYYKDNPHLLDKENYNFEDVE